MLTRIFVQDIFGRAPQVASGFERRRILAIVRACRDDDLPRILEIVNAAAAKYQGAIPDDCWREPYMARGELRHDVAAGVAFTGYEMEGVLVGVMGVQSVLGATLIRHAYVLPSHQRLGIGRILMQHLFERSGTAQILVGTWADATWAINFYERNGFSRVSPAMTRTLLAKYWTVPARQAAVSVVLAKPPIS